MKRYPRYKDSKVKWIGNVPEHWKTVPFGSGFRYFKGLSITKADLLPAGTPVISYGQIHSKDNLGTTVSPKLIRYVSPTYLNTDSQSLVQKGDFIFADTSEDLGGCGNCVCVDQEQTIFAGYHTLVCHPTKKINTGYIAYLFLSAPWRDQLRTQCNAVKVYSVSRGKLKKTVLLIPPEPEQRAIVAFLDRAVEKIDGYIAAKEAEIEKLGTLKQSVIAKAVTQGLNPDVPMKDSGIPWLGNVPEHWGITTAKHILKKLERPTVFEAPVLICSNHGEVFYRGERRIGLISLTEHDYQGVEPGDLLIHGMDTWHGAIAISNLSGKCTSVVHVCSSSQNKTFVMYYLQALAIKKVFKAITNGVRQNTSDFRSWNEAGKITVLVPPLDEQNNIVEFISSKIQQSNEYITGIRAQIEKLKVYKQRLISDVVTGKICVCDQIEQAN